MLHLLVEPTRIRKTGPQDDHFRRVSSQPYDYIGCMNVHILFAIRKSGENRQRNPHDQPDDALRMLARLNATSAALASRCLSVGGVTAPTALGPLQPCPGAMPGWGQQTIEVDQMDSLPTPQQSP